MVYILNVTACLLTILFGLFGFLAPRYTARALDLQPTASTMGLSEMRASVGGLFVACGVFCIFIDNPMAYITLGVAFIGAALGRLVSLAMDSPPTRKVILFGAVEAVLALWLIVGNIA